MNRRSLIVLVSASALVTIILSLLLTSANSGTSQAQPINSIALASAASLSPALQQSVVTPSQLKVVLIRLNLEPSALAAAGVSANSVGAIVSAVQDELEEVPSALSTLDGAAASGSHLVDTLERTIQSGMGNPENVTALAEAQSDLSAVNVQRQSLLQSIFTDATVNIGNPQRARLQAIRDNAVWELPIEYRVTARTEAQWVKLRDALAQERYALAHQLEVAPEVQQYLAEVRSNPDVASAITSLGTNLAAVNTAWNQAIQG